MKTKSTRIKKYLLILVVGLFQQEVFAQNFLPFVYDTLDRHHEINLNASGEFASSSISNQLTNRFIFGGEINPDLIQKIEGKQKNLNRIGFYTDPNIEYINYKVRPFQKKDWGIIVKAGLLSSAGARYKSGAFGLAFRGNEPYLGSTIDLSNMFVGMLAAHKVGFGFISSKSKSNVSLNFYGITNYINGYLNEASLYQDETGFNAELAMNGKAMTTTKSPYYKGLGVGIDANFYFKVGKSEKPSFIQFSVQNLGVGFINKNVVRYEMDTTILYDGYTIANLTNGETLFGKDKNITEEIGLKNDTISRTVALPFTVQIAKIIDEHNTKAIQFYYGIRVYVHNSALPMGYFGVHYRTKTWFRMGLGASYGGYTGFRANLYLQAALKNFNVGISTSDLIGLTGFGKGYGLSLGASYRF